MDKTNGFNKRYEYRVDFNGKQFIVVFNKCDENGIELKQIADELKQLSRSDVGLETHLFQVFDKRTQKYITVGKTNQMIKNMSNIRVEKREAKRLQYFVDFNGNKYDICFDDCISDGIKLKQIIAKLSALTKTPIKYDLHSFEVFDQNRKKFQKYNPNFGQLIQNLSQIRILTKKTTKPVNRMSSEVRNEFNNRLMQSINSSMIGSIINWKSVCLRMKSFGYFDLSEDEFRRVLDELVAKYIEVLQNCNNSHRNGCRLWPLFANLNDLDLKPFMRPDTYQMVMDLRKSLLIDSKQTKSLIKTENQLKANVKTNANSFEAKEKLKFKYDSKPNIEKLNSFVDYSKPIRTESVKKDFYLLLVETVLKTEPKFNWNLVSKAMQLFGFSQVNEKQCESYFRCGLISKYITVLEKCNSESDATKRLPCFRLINGIDLKPFVREDTYYKILELKNRYKTSSKNSNKVIENLVSEPIQRNSDSNKTRVIVPEVETKAKTSWADQMDESIEKMDLMPVPSQHVSKANFNNKSEYNLNSNLSKVSQSSEIKNSLNSIEKSYRNLKNKSNKSRHSLNGINGLSNNSNNFNSGVQLQKSNNLNELQVMNKTVTILPVRNQSNDRDWKLSKSVAECMANNNTNNSNNSNNIKRASDRMLFWQMVCKQMQNNEYFESIDAIECKTIFHELLEKYLKVLETSKSLTEARNALIYFDFLNYIDLSRFFDPIRTQTVICLRHKLGFDKKSQIFAKEDGNGENRHKSQHRNNNRSNSSPQKTGQPFTKKRENPKFDKINIRYNEIESNKRRKFANLCYDRDYQLIKTGVIDKQDLKSQLSNCSTVAEQVMTFRKIVLLSEDDYTKRNKLKDILETLVRESGIDCEFHFFGSTANCVGFCNSDIDLFIEIKELENYNKKIDFNTAMSYLTVIKTIFKKTLNFFIPNPIASLRCPIIKIDFKCLSEKFKYFRHPPDICESIENLGISCDINISNALGLQNSKLIRLFCELEPRFQELAIILRYWAKSNDFIGGGDNAMTSYAFTHLVIFFCQTQTPPLLPTVDQLRQMKTPSVIVDGWECSFCADTQLIQKSTNSESLIELLPKFFKFYANFDFTTQVIQPKTGLSVHKYLFNTLVKTTLNTELSDVLHFKMSSFCCIEDPFNLEHNLTANLSFAVFDRFLEHIKQIAFNSDVIFSPNKGNHSATDWGISKMITKFDPTDGQKTIIDSYVCNPNPKLCVKYANISAEEVMKIFANQVCHTIPILLKTVYKIELKSDSKWDIICGQISPFAQFTIDLNETDLQIIDSNNRDLIRSQFKQFLDKNNKINKEIAITDEILNRLKDKQLSELSIKCRFVLYCNGRPSGACIGYEIIELQSEHKLLTNFFNSIIDLIPKMIDENDVKS